MDIRIKELVELTQKKFGLSNYYLQEHQFYRSVNEFNETVYTLSMEWFPNQLFKKRMVQIQMGQQVLK